MSLMASRVIYRLCYRADWNQAEELGTYAGTATDRRDGFLHFSTAEQVADTARLHFTGASDLLMLEVPVSRLGPALKWEMSRSGQSFPHLYDTLAVDLVSGVVQIPLDEAGRHSFPSYIRQPC